jgi:O-antigen ligase
MSSMAGTAGLSRRDAIGYAVVVLLVAGAVVLAQALAPHSVPGWPLLAALPALPVGLFVLARWPETGVYLILLLLSFGNEYSQTEWGVRSADQLATIYNRRVLPGVLASPFDLALVAVLVVWLARKWLGRERLFWPPPGLRLAAIACLAVTFYATVLGLYRLPQGVELYYVLRELRPFVYALAVLVFAVDVITRRASVATFWRLVVVLAFVRGVQGIVLHALGIGRWYYGTTMVYYDYADTILLLAGMAFVFTWLLGRARLRAATLAVGALAILPMAYSFVFSYRRSFWIGAAVALGLLLVALTRVERRRYLALAGLGVVALAGLVLATGQSGLVGRRLSSITALEGDASNTFRVFDTANALGAIYESAALGMGFGSRYRVEASIYWLAEFLGHVSRASHNGYLYLLMKMGLAGLLAWTAFWLIDLAVCVRLARSPGSRFRHIGLGVGLVLIASAVANLFLPLYYNLRPLMLLALFSAPAIAAWNEQRAAARAAERTP